MFLHVSRVHKNGWWSRGLKLSGILPILFFPAHLYAVLYVNIGTWWSSPPPTLSHFPAPSNFLIFISFFAAHVFYYVHVWNLHFVVERTKMSEESTIQKKLENDDKSGGCFNGNIHATIRSILYQIWSNYCRHLRHITWTCEIGKHTLRLSIEYQHKMRMYELSCVLYST